MRRAWLLAMLLAGCDLVYGLEGRVPPEARPGDEDGDGRLDDNDACPHIAFQADVDDDGDGIAADCDPDDEDKTTMFRWFPIKDGLLGGDFTQEGMIALVDNTFQLGNNDDLSWLVFDVDATTMTLDVGFEIVSNAIEDVGEQPWAELGLHTVYRDDTDEQRGSVCFLGISQDTEEDPPLLEDAYLELKGDEQTKPTVTFAPPLDGTIGRLYQFRTTEKVRCGLVRTGEALLTASYDVTRPTTVGKFAISADRIVANLTHIWIAWQPR